MQHKLSVVLLLNFFFAHAYEEEKIILPGMEEREAHLQVPTRPVPATPLQKPTRPVPLTPVQELEAQYQQARQLFTGDKNTKKDEVRGFQQLKAVADKPTTGDLKNITGKAQTEVAFIYLNDKKDYANAIAYFRRATVNGNETAKQMYTDILYQQVQQEAKKKNTQPMRELGRSYLGERDKVYRDFKRGLELLQKAADLGNKDAQTDVAYIYMTELFDADKALAYFKKAAAQKEDRALAQLQLGEKAIREQIAFSKKNSSK